MLVAGWDTPLVLTRQEVAQREYEGCRVPDDTRSALAALDPVRDSHSKVLSAIRARLAALEPTADFPYVQPNDLEDIRQVRPDGPRRMRKRLSEDVLLDKLHGAWTGRAAGCALGKPVELLGMFGFGGDSGRRAIRRYLEARDAWPLRDYFIGAPSAAYGAKIICPESWRENIAYMEPDDDIHYTLIALKVLEERGAGFTWANIADTWNNSLPYSAICTAETQAILNYNLTTPNKPMGRRPLYTTPEFTRTHNNPYREWIGAQIRADGWAYACAGEPELAAEFAWRDAHWTHTANGIYGEMMMAAIIAAAFVEDDPKRLVEIGLSEIPAQCRLAEAVREAMGWIEAGAGFEDFMQQLEAKHGGLSPVHTVNNALIVVMSLFTGGGEPDRVIADSVMAGLDTDCNGATAGSIAGAVRGKSRFGGTLQTALNDTIRPLVFGFQEVTMHSLAERTLAVHKRVMKERDL